MSLAEPAGVSASAIGNVAAAPRIARTSTAAPGQPGRYQWLWPPVDTPEGARYAVRQAMWGAIFVCLMTTLMVIISASAAASRDPRFEFSAWALLDAAVFAVIAFGIWRQSRVAAVAGLGVYILEQVYMLTIPAQFGVGRLIVIVALLSAFTGGIRGTFALHDFRIRGEI